jgi:hypothetical protein
VIIRVSNKLFERIRAAQAAGHRVVLTYRGKYRPTGPTSADKARQISGNWAYGQGVNGHGH